MPLPGICVTAIQAPAILTLLRTSPPPGPPPKSQACNPVSKSLHLECLTPIRPDNKPIRKSNQRTDGSEDSDSGFLTVVLQSKQRQTIACLADTLDVHEGRNRAGGRSAFVAMGGRGGSSGLEG